LWNQSYVNAKRLDMSPAVEFAVPVLGCVLHHCAFAPTCHMVWLQVFGANEAVRLVMDVLDGGGSAAEAAQALVREAVRRAMEGPDGDADNTTAVVRAENAECVQHQDGNMQSFGQHIRTSRRSYSIPYMS